MVIAIIALLMAILMPALNKAKEQSKTVVCQTYLKQWGVVFEMYSSDYPKEFIVFCDFFPPMRRLGEWYRATASYYQDYKLRLCPKATILAQPPQQGSLIRGGKKNAWASMYVDDPIAGGLTSSYGMNTWTNTLGRDEVRQAPFKARVDLSLMWKGLLNIKGAGNVPLLLDCGHPGGLVDPWDPPPSEDDAWRKRITGPSNGYVSAFMINRHNGFINCAFADSSVRKVGLKELLSPNIKWRRNWTSDLKGVTIVWPEWMKKFKDYD